MAARVTLKFPFSAVQRVGNSFGCCVSSFYFSVLRFPSEVHLCTCGSQEAGKSLGRKCRPTSWTGEGVFSKRCRRQSCSPASAPLATFCGENHPQHQRSHKCGNLWNGAEISVLQVLGQCPQLHNYSCFPSKSFMQTATLPNPNPTASTSAPSSQNKTSSHALQAFSIRRAPVMWEVGKSFQYFSRDHQ